MGFDLLIKDCKTLDNKIINIIIDNGKIVKILENIDVLENQYKKIIDLKKEKYVSAGWIDIHTHCYERLELYHDIPDEIGYKTGVTSIVDAGTTGGNNIDGFYEDTKKYKTNIFALINISKNGITTQDELSDIENIDVDIIKEAIKKHPDFIIGLKARMSKSVIGENGIYPLKMARKIKNEVKLPLMVHFGTAPPRIEEILSYMEKGDILTHIYNGKPNGIFKAGILCDEVKKARERGIIFDVGHGTESFSIDVAKKAYDMGFYPDTISTDIYKGNRGKGPVYNLATTMEKFLYLGYPLKYIIECVTKNAAKVMNLKNKGEIKEGYDGDITIFEILEEKVQLRDSLNKIVEGNTIIKPTKVVVGGEDFNI